MKLSQEVVFELTTMARGMLALQAALTLDPEILNDSYGKTLETQAAKLGVIKSLKSWQNYVSAARALLVKCSDMIADPTVKSLTELLAAQLKKGGYITTPEDVTNWCKGNPSIKARAAQKRKAELKALQDAAAAAEAAPAPAPAAAAAPAPAPAAEAAPEAEAAAAAAPAAAPATEAAAAPATEAAAAPATEAAPKVDSFWVTFSKDGTLAIDPDIPSEVYASLIQTLQQDFREMFGIKAKA